MFANTAKFRTRAAVRAADAIDLLIDLATLGEYGLEYPRTPEGEAARRARQAHAGATAPRRARRAEGPGRLAAADRDRASIRHRDCPGTGRSRRDHVTRTRRPSPRRNPAGPATPCRTDRPRPAARAVDHRPSRLPEALRPPRIRIPELP